MENKCPHCGAQLPKSSAFCMHCMQGIYEKEVVPAPQKKSKKSAMIILIALLAIGICSGIAYAAVHRRAIGEQTTVSTSVSTSAATSETQAQTTTKQTTTKKKKKKKKTTTKAQTTAAPDTAAAQPATEATQPATQAPATQNTQVLISGSVLTDYPNTRRDSSYTIPYEVSSISGGAFHGNPYLRTLRFSKRANLSCNWSSLFANLPNLETIYIYTGTTADTQGMQYFDGEIIYYYD